MKDMFEEIQYKDKIFRLVFNLNVMERVQEEYGTVENLINLISDTDTEINAKALKFMFTEMLNEGIDICNEENGTDEKLLTPKQVGRIITEIGMTATAQAVNKTIDASVKSEEKN